MSCLLFQILATPLQLRTSQSLSPFAEGQVNLKVNPSNWGGVLMTTPEALI